MRTWFFISCLAVLLHHTATARQRPARPPANAAVKPHGLSSEAAAAPSADSLQLLLKRAQENNDTLSQLATLEKIAIQYIRDGETRKAEALLQQLLTLQHKLGIKKTQVTCDYLVTVYRSQGNLSQALHYAIEAVKLAESLGDSAGINRHYGRLGAVYKDLGQYDKSLQYYLRSLARLQQHTLKDTFQLYTATSNVVNILLKLDRTSEALNLIETTTGAYPSVKPDIKQLTASMRGETYAALKNNKLAEKYYLEAVYWEEYQPHGFVLRFNTYFNLGEFYCSQGQFEKARPYLMEAANTGGFASHSTQRNIQLLLFRADSASGNYLAAIRHYQVYKAISDTMFNVAQSQQIEEMQARYETEKKEQDIQLLRHESQQQQTQLEQAVTDKKVTASLIGLLLVIIALLFFGYRIRKKNNLRLESQQAEIQRKNTSLEELILEKDELLQDKEWLLKEIHHRVNNNLQIVISLLNTQLAYLNDESATVAIRDSQHRMRAMSLIHQRLYQSDKLAIIDMQAYIRELISYLDDNFNVNHRIRFILELPALELNVSQAVPVGLILNEAITNAIKYAFQSGKAGTIIVNVREEDNDRVSMQIADDGAGLPEGFDLNASHTLGVNLMKGLARQLNGTFAMENREGTVVMVNFLVERTVTATERATAPLTA